MIYKGSQKEGNVYKGATKIGKIYKGNRLVYQSGLKLYVAEYQNVNNMTAITGLLGSWSTSGYVVAWAGADTIYSISGTLGTNGSYVTQSSGGSQLAYRYVRTINISNRECYVYMNTNYGLGTMIVLKDSVVGNYVLYCLTLSTSGVVQPSSVTSNSFTYTGSNGTQTVNKTSNDVLTFTKERGLT